MRAHLTVTEVPEIDVLVTVRIKDEGLELHIQAVEPLARRVRLGQLLDGIDERLNLDLRRDRQVGRNIVDLVKDRHAVGRIVPIIDKDELRDLGYIAPRVKPVLPNCQTECVPLLARKSALIGDIPAIAQDELLTLKGIEENVVARITKCKSLDLALFLGIDRHLDHARDAELIGVDLELLPRIAPHPERIIRPVVRILGLDRPGVGIEILVLIALQRGAPRFEIGQHRAPTARPRGWSEER